MVIEILSAVASVCWILIIADVFFGGDNPDR